MNQIVTAKPWGKSIRRFIDQYCQLEEIHVDQGGYSSVHLHRRKFNWFFVAEGKLRVSWYEDRSNSPKLSRVVEPGMRALAQPNERHQFLAETEVVAYEYYLDPSGYLDAEDIQRFSDNGTYVKISMQERSETTEYCSLCNRPLTVAGATVYLNGAMRSVCSKCSSILSEGGGGPFP